MKSWKNISFVRLERALLYLLPIVVFFSYAPVIMLGSNEKMNFELSLPLIWLAAFGIISLLKLPVTLKKVERKLFFVTLIIPSYALISVLWSANLIRGILAAGILSLIWLTALNIVSSRLERGMLRRMMKIYLTTAVVVGIFCILQCFLDVLNVSREITGLCLGCKYETLGFPHPNGFAIEPQFMGNLLIAPALISLFDFYETVRNKDKKAILFGKFLRCIFLNMTLFITFSRGALFASYAAIILFMLYLIVRRREFVALIFISVVMTSGVCGLFLQGIWAEISPTNEGFSEGIARSINHLSLGKIDFREKNKEETENEAQFSGYIAESTDIRLNINEIALKAWQKTPVRIIFGAGLGSAGIVMAEENETLGPKEIVQNQYISLLLELGVTGCLLIICCVVILIKRVKIPEKTGVIIVAYLCSMGFFAGLTNVLHIYLLTPVVGKVERELNMLN